MSAAPQVTNIVILDEDEAGMAAVAVRMYLANLRSAYRANLRKGHERYAARCVEKFDAALDLYDRLGGNPDAVLDINEKGRP